MVITFRRCALFFIASAAAVLAAVYISQYGFGLRPCHLCLYQRIPYFAAVALGMMLFAFSGNKKLAQLLTVFLAIAFVVSAALAIFHMGVEYKWWQYASDCTGIGFKKGATADDILAALKKAPVTRCDEPVSFLFGMSMAFYNVLVSAGLAIAASIAAFKTKI